MGQSEGHRAAVGDAGVLDGQCHPKKLFVGGLVHKTTTQGLRDHFGQFGIVVDAVVLRWPDGRSRGFGYVTFAEASAAAVALREKHKVEGRDVDVKRAMPGTNKLFVGGLPQSAGAADLREHFEAFGIVSDTVVMVDPTTTRSRGFGFVCFLPGQEGAAAVVWALERYKHHQIHGKWIEVKSATPPHKLVVKEEGPPQPQACASASVSRAPAPVLSAQLPALGPPPASQPGVGWGATPGVPLSPLPWPPAPPLEAPTLLPRLGRLPPGLEQHAGPKAARVEPRDEPLKIRPPTFFASWGLECRREASQELGAGPFDASEDLRRSLEQLLRLRDGAREQLDLELPVKLET